MRPQDASQQMEDLRRLLSDRQLELDTRIEVFVLCRTKGRLVACGGLDRNVIKCVAVAPEFVGQSLSLRLGSELITLAAARGQFHLFLYSAPHNRELFRGWGFYPLVEVPGLVVLMENSPIAIKGYCDSLRSQRRPGVRIGCAVLNANPFTLGHRFLLERAAGQCDWLHVFVVKENASTFSYSDRFALVAQGVHGICRLTLHEGSEYIISRATFPGYFFKDKAVIDHSWAGIDLLLFREYIAPALGITHRYVGTEPLDAVTNNYNADMRHWLQDTPSSAPAIAVVEVPRASVSGTPISASTVRRLLAEEDFAAIDKLVPPSTLKFLETKYAAARLAAGGEERT
jgi:[citrate (pro-3S)-lyase] ligase